MKKALIFAVLLALALTLAACRDNNDTPTDTVNAGAPETSPPATPPTDGDPTPAVAHGGWNGWNPFPNGFPEEWDEWAERMHEFNNFFTPVDLGGAVVRINAADPELIEDEAIREEMTARRDWVQQSFNIIMEFNVLDGIEWSEVPDQVIASVAAGDPIVHLFRATNGNNWFPRLASADVLIPDNGWIVNTFPENWWAGAGEFEGVIYGFESEFPFAANMGLLYNRALIQQVGMDYTPSEMFTQGRWNHEEFYSYLSRLNELLPADVIPLASPFSQLGLGFVFANGSFVKDPATGLPAYLNEPFLDTVRLMQRLGQSGLMALPGFDAENDVWSQGAEFFPPAVPRFQEHESAMSVVQRWQFYGTSALVEYGFVPYPWGSNVQWPASGDWRDLANNGYTSFMNDTNMFTVVRGAPAGITHELAASIAFSYLMHDNAMRAMIAHAEGHDNPVSAPNVNNLFEDIDRELWQWYSDQAVLEVSGRMGIPPTFWSSVMAAIATNTDVRPALEAVLGEDIWTMVDRGLISQADIPASMWALAEEFNAVQQAEADAATEATDED
ncbi:MAG: hypothetical protein FWG38_00205 [Defluviitaleaceae bacterium]|nr:hypothetical protein [Defluviitaleaceae bacterium]